MFGWRKRKQAAAEEAAREAERRAILAKLAERPEHICPFLGLEGERAGYVDGISDEHRCFAFGDPGRLSSEQQTRVCQEPGYGNCPRYLRGVLVIPTEELDALRRRPVEPAAAPPPPAPPPRRRRRRPAVAILGLLLLVAIGGGAAYLFATGEFGIGAIDPTSSPSPQPEPTIRTDTPTPMASPEPSASPPETSPGAEPTPEAGDEFAHYEVSVDPGSYTLYLTDDDGTIVSSRPVSFAGFSFGRAAPIASVEAVVLWRIEDGNLAGYAYRYPESGEFGVRAVFFSDSGERRTYYLDASELDEFPTQTPAPSP